MAFTALTYVVFSLYAERGAPLSPLDMFTVAQIDTHIAALRAETFQRRFRSPVFGSFWHRRFGLSTIPRPYGA